MRSMTAALLGLAFALVASPDMADAQRRRGVPVNIETTPPGAEVYVDSVSPENLLGRTPLRNVRIERGNHTLLFKLANHEDAQQAVYIRRRRETFRQELNALATLDITAGNTAATGAAVRVDGQPVGNVPHRMTVQPGRHLVQVGREGYVTFNQWTDLAGGQALTLPVILEEQAPSTGSLLVAGDVSGAQITIDGTPRGTTPAVIDGLTEGQHTVEVRASDAGMQPFTQTVTIVAGQRLTLSPTLRPAPPQGGSLRVLANAQGAIISVDGEVVGEAPASASDLTPGEHIVEARAEGYQPIQQPVTIEAGRQRVISLTLTQVQAALGRIVVNANVDGATVFVDGEERGSVPVVIEAPQAGTHAIIVRAPGHEEHRETCAVGPGQSCEITARLSPVGTPVRVEANVNNAVFVVDGEVMGPVPWEGTIPVGSHLIEVRADGMRSHTEQRVFRVGQDVTLINVGLVGADELTPEERQEREQERLERHRQTVARSGATLPDDLAVLDFSLGWPYLFEFRLGIGITNWLEAGIGLRTFGILTEFEGRVKAGYRPVRQVSVGAQARIGGGLGPSRDATAEEQTAAMMMGEIAPEHDTNTFFFSLEALFSLHFLNAGNFTLWAGLDYHSDRWDWNLRDRDCRYADGCPMGMPGMELIEGRQKLARFRIGGSLEFIINSNWNVWGSFEGVIAGNSRRVLGDIWGQGHDDVQLYTRLGLTYKFGYVERD